MEKLEKIIEVAIPGASIDETFEYIVDSKDIEKLEIGKVVTVSFFKKIYNAIILKIKDSSDYEYSKLKKIIALKEDEPLLTLQLLKLAEWLSEYYVCSINRTLAFFLPPTTIQKSQKIIRLIAEKDEYLEQLKKLINQNQAYQDLLNMLEEEKEIKFTTLSARFDNINIDAMLNTLKNKGIIEYFQEFEERQQTEEQRIFLTKDYEEKIAAMKISSIQKKIIECVRENNGDYNSSQIIKIIGCTASPLKTLIKHGVLETRKIKKQYKLTEIYTEEEKKIILNDEQENALNAIAKKIEEDKYSAFLLYGITGSGKTEIYMRAIQKVIDADGECIMLVPEISLTPQTVARFKNRFGEKIAVLHSMLSQAERLEQWQNVRAGKTKIVVGARSAIFAPFKNLKLIIVDEEHENSYKQTESPAYNGRDVAIYRAYLENCVIILGSATPTLESYYNAAIAKKYELLKLTKRADPSALMQQVEI
ncbi:MAG TPA: primosomal protein N', partial [bacterium]|nr:primosomal protein N' [bacterium]